MNGLGRIIFGMLHDRCGFRVSLLADALLYIAAGAVAALSLGGSYASLIAAMMVIGAATGLCRPSPPQWRASSSARRTTGGTSA